MKKKLSQSVATVGILLLASLTFVAPASSGPISPTDCSNAKNYDWVTVTGSVFVEKAMMDTRRFTNPAGTCQVDRFVRLYSAQSGTNFWKFRSSDTSGDPSVARVFDEKVCGAFSSNCVRWRSNHAEKVTYFWNFWYTYTF